MTMVEDEDVVIPAFTVPARAREMVDEIRSAVLRVEPAVDEIYAKALELRDLYEDVLREIGKDGRSLEQDGLLEVVGEAVGWSKVWERLVRLFGDRFSDQAGFDHETMRGPELRRGGEANFPPGTRARLVDRDGVSWEVEVAHAPYGQKEDLYTIVTIAEPHDRFMASHDEIKAGLIEVPDKKARGAALLLHYEWETARIRREKPYYMRTITIDDDLEVTVLSGPDDQGRYLAIGRTPSERYYISEEQIRDGLEPDEDPGMPGAGQVQATVAGEVDPISLDEVDR
ncbi:MAG: hypothetical protein AB7L84_14875 [Acidimicrobiia bacterium]